MKNRIKKLIFGSVTRELFLTIILSFAFVALIVSFIPSPISDIVIYIIIILIYLLYIRKSNYIKTISQRSLENTIDLNGYDELNLKNRVKKIIFGSVTRELLATVILGIILIKSVSNMIIVLILIYLLIRTRTEYIKYMYSGINKISEGNLDYKIRVEGYDELATLAEEINNMSTNLKDKIEEERAVERLKSELITNVSHDLRTPLTALIGYIQLAADDNTSFEDKDKYAKISLENSKKLKVLIDDLFEYSKLESGGIKLKKVKVNIIEIIEQSIGELSIQAKERYIGFKKNFKNSKVELLVDPNKIARVFENIIGNAIKYSVEGSDVNINLYENDENVIISFENRVDKVLEKDLEKIFNRFYRTDESRNSEVSGSGLGLAIAKNIVELHGGKIWAENQTDKFIINIELNRVGL
ncbi:sensor histidine kinase [Clostridium amazonitimonense]|uniref:sensor histidine kinase n=1 Tax=Clostridium amazonitimonense TaxID=1499689 RepID=UPI0006893348|nr:ATP-binding protein [Clostridium amazonitimonense]